MLLPSGSKPCCLLAAAPCLLVARVLICGPHPRRQRQRRLGPSSRAGRGRQLRGGALRLRQRGRGARDPGSDGLAAGHDRGAQRDRQLRLGGHGLGRRGVLKPRAWPSRRARCTTLCGPSSRFSGPRATRVQRRTPGPCQHRAPAATARSTDWPFTSPPPGSRASRRRCWAAWLAANADGARAMSGGTALRLSARPSSGCAATPSWSTGARTTGRRRRPSWRRWPGLLDVSWQPSRGALGGACTNWGLQGPCKERARPSRPLFLDPVAYIYIYIYIYK